MDAKNYSATTPPLPGTSRDDFMIFEGAPFNLFLGGGFKRAKETCTFARTRFSSRLRNPRPEKIRRRNCRRNGFRLSQFAQIFIDANRSFAALPRSPRPPAIARGACRRPQICPAPMSCNQHWSRRCRARRAATPNCSSMPLRTGPRKPIASSTRSTSMVNSVPAIGSNFGGGPTRTP